GDPLYAVLVSGPTHGTLTFKSDGSFVYTPSTHYSGSDSFTYQAFDGTTTSSTATVSLTITNATPAAVNDHYSILSSGTATITAANGLLANDTDDDDSLTASLVSGPSHGTLSLSSDGSFTYTPGGGFSTSDSFTYHAVSA